MSDPVCRDCQSFLPRLTRDRKRRMSGWGICTWGYERSRPDPRHAISGKLLRSTDGCTRRWARRDSATQSWLDERVARARKKASR